MHRAGAALRLFEGLPSRRSGEPPMRVQFRCWHTNLPISNVRFDGECRGVKTDNICSMRVLRILTDSVEKVSKMKLCN